MTTKTLKLTHWKIYLELTKPGILMGNVLTALAGFALASSAASHLKTLPFTLIGLLLVMASACVFNNFIDREYDAKMTRTANRALAARLISSSMALSFGSLLGLFGFLVLALKVSLFACLLTSLAFMVYVLIYSFLKHHSPIATLVGSLAGAAPPVIGYCSLTQRWDTQAWLLFLALVCWQMPHFYAIALFRMQDYKKASLPVLPLVKGLVRTKVSMLGYLLALEGVFAAFSFLKVTSWGFFYVMSLLNALWIFFAIQGFWKKDASLWGRKMFFYSLAMILGFCFCLVGFKI